MSEESEETKSSSSSSSLLSTNLTMKTSRFQACNKKHTNDWSSSPLKFLRLYTHLFVYIAVLFNASSSFVNGAPLSSSSSSLSNSNNYNNNNNNNNNNLVDPLSEPKTVQQLKSLSNPLFSASTVFDRLFLKYLKDSVDKQLTNDDELEPKLDEYFKILPKNDDDDDDEKDNEDNHHYENYDDYDGGYVANHDDELIRRPHHSASDSDGGDFLIRKRSSSGSNRISGGRSSSDDDHDSSRKSRHVDRLDGMKSDIEYFEQLVGAYIRLLKSQKKEERDRELLKAVGLQILREKQKIAKLRSNGRRIQEFQENTTNGRRRRR